MSKARDIASAAPAPAGVTSTELGYVDGVTSAIQTQINAKQAVVSGVNDTEIGYLDGVTSAIQTQINSKIGQSTAINPSTITAKGDLIVGTGSGTFTAQGVGANGTVLTANSAQADGVEWAALPASGGMTEITTTTLNNTVTSYTYSSLGSYKHILITGSALQYDGAGNNNLRIRFNGDTGSNYNHQRIQLIASSTPSGAFGGGETFIEAGVPFGYTGDTSERFGNFRIWIYNYREAIRKDVYFDTRAFPGTNQAYSTGSGYWNNTAAITSITLLTALGGNLKSGTIRVFGVN